MKRYRRWLLKRRLARARRLLMFIDAGIKRMGMSRQARRQMWRDFAKGKDDHAEIFDLIKVK